MKPKVFAHGPYIGTTGYANHTREFFRHLSKLIPVKVRNFTIGKSWEGFNDEPHNGEPYIDDLDNKTIGEFIQLIKQNKDIDNVWKHLYNQYIDMENIPQNKKLRINYCF
jgi:hypothetical protein